MCGILFYMNQVCILNTDSIKCRGPDQSETKLIGRHSVGFTRLSINDTTVLGMQPMKCGRWSMVCNGEIYNYKQLKKDLYNFTSESDCEVIVKLLYNTDGNIQQVYRMLDGEFAFIGTNGDRVVVARDHVGVRPLYMQLDPNGKPFVFSSLIKGLELTNMSSSIFHFPPGYVYDSDQGFISMEPEFVYTKLPYSQNSIFDLLCASVKKRINNTDRNIGFLLSGGLDSTILVCIAKFILKLDKIQTFSVGFHKDSPDLKYAREVANFVGSYHNEYILDIEKAYERIPEIISNIETYDCTTVRASVPMYLMCEKINKETTIKVLLSGEGSDEIFNGYIYSHRAPTYNDLFIDSCELLKNIHEFDGLRADRCVGSWGLELRVPFLDKEFVRYVMEVHPLNKVSDTVIEKKILRDTFRNCIPESVYRRSKNGMSDAVGSEWIQYIKERCEQIPDVVYAELKIKYNNLNRPVSKEEAWYRELYHAYFPDEICNPQSTIWRPKWTRETDPSARKLEQFVE